MASTRSATASVERVCERDLDERTLRVELVRAFRTAVPFEDYAWLLTDPETTVGSAPLADVRCLPELPRLIGLRYRTTVNRWTMLTGAASLAQATGGDLAQSLVWRELLHRHDVGDVATVVFRDGFACGVGSTSGARAVNRRSPKTRSASSRSAPGRSPRRCAGLSCGASPTARRPAGRRVSLCSCSADLDVLAQTPQTTEYLRLLVPPAAGRSPVPAARSTSAAQLRAVEVGLTATRRRPESTCTAGDGSPCGPTGSATDPRVVATSRSPSS